METQTLEGTWEEILQHSAELAGQRVRLTILPHESRNASMIQTLEEKLKGRVGRVNGCISNMYAWGFPSSLNTCRDAIYRVSTNMRCTPS